jgi:hypothetical protein
MPRCHLRVYYGPESSAQPGDGERVTLPLKDVFPLLADAVRSQRTWLADFEDDQITISADLYEVLLAYQHYRRPSA